MLAISCSVMLNPSLERDNVSSSYSTVPRQPVPQSGLSEERIGFRGEELQMEDAPPGGDEFLEVAVFAKGELQDVLGTGPLKDAKNKEVRR